MTKGIGNIKKLDDLEKEVVKPVKKFILQLFLIIIIGVMLMIGCVVYSNNKARQSRMENNIVNNLNQMGEVFAEVKDSRKNYIKSSKKAEEARNLILKEDSNYISKYANYGAKLETSYREISIEESISNKNWNLPQEDVYEFIISDANGDEYCSYLVGKKSKNVYCIPHQGLYSVYQIKNNEKVKTYKWVGSDKADIGNWR